MYTYTYHNLYLIINEILSIKYLISMNSYYVKY